MSNRLKTYLLMAAILFFFRCSVVDTPRNLKVTAQVNKRLETVDKSPKKININVWHIDSFNILQNSEPTINTATELRIQDKIINQFPIVNQNINLSKTQDRTLKFNYKSKKVTYNFKNKKPIENKDKYPWELVRFLLIILLLVLLFLGLIYWIFGATGIIIVFIIVVLSIIAAFLLLFLFLLALKWISHNGL